MSALKKVLAGLILAPFMPLVAIAWILARIVVLGHDAIEWALRQFDRSLYDL